MRLVRVTSTGKFNYHLNILGDLIEKDEDGKYRLSEKGRLIAQSLPELDKLEVEPLPPPMSMKPFETRAFSLAQGLIWTLLVYPVTWVLSGWYLYFNYRASAFAGDPTVPLMIFTVIIGAPFALFGMAAFPKIEIDRDGSEVKSGFIRRSLALEEIRMDTRGHVLKLGEGLATAGWFIPFKEKECVALLNKHVRSYRSKPFFLAYLLPLSALGSYYEIIAHLGGTLSPLYWAFSWGTTAAISMSIFFYGIPADIQLGSLGRGASAMIFGLSVGITISFLMFLSLQIR